MKKQRLSAWIAVSAALALSLAGCGNSGSSGSTKEITSAQSAGTAQGASASESIAAGETAASGETSGTQTEAASDTSDTTIDEQVLLDANDVKVTATQYTSDGLLGDSVNLLIENNGSSDIGIGCNALIVNNYMIGNLFSTEVSAGKKSNESLDLYSSELEAAGIDNVGQIEVYLHLFDPDSYETVYEADPVTIKTSHFDDMDTTPNDDGQELYNEGGIRIVGKYVDENSFWGNAIVLYLENKSDQDVLIQCDDLSVNGYMMTPYFSCDVYKDKMAISTIDLMSSELEQNGIDSVEDVELTFNIINPDTFETIRTTDPISFSAQ